MSEQEKEGMEITVNNTGEAVKPESNEDTVEMKVNTKDADLELDEADISDDGTDSSDIKESKDIAPEAMTKFSKSEMQKMAEENEKEIEQEERAEAASGTGNNDNRTLDENGAQVVTGSRRSIRRTYSAPRIRAIDGLNGTEFTDATTILRKYLADYTYAASSFHDGHGLIMKGTVASVTNNMVLRNKKGETRRMPMLVVADGPIAVYIPISKFTRRRVNEDGTAQEEGRNNEISVIANQRIGSEVEYMVQRFDQTRRIALATRLPVLDRKATRYYMTPVRGGGYMINEGDIVEARVIFMTANYLGIEAFGVEASIPVGEVTWSRVYNLYDYYREKGISNMVGKTVPVKVMKISRDPLEVTFSVKRGSFDERALYVGHLHPRDNVKGTISVVENGRIFAKLNGLPFDCLCNLNRDFFNIPAVGTTVMINLHEINVKKDEYGDPKYEINGYITNILG